MRHGFVGSRQRSSHRHHGGRHDGRHPGTSCRGVPRRHGCRGGQGRATERRAEPVRARARLRGAARGDGHAVRRHEPREAGHRRRRPFRAGSGGADPPGRPGRRVRDELSAGGTRTDGRELRAGVCAEPSSRVRARVGLRPARPRRRQGHARRGGAGSRRPGRHLGLSRRAADAARRGDRRSLRCHATGAGHHDGVVRARADRSRPGGQHVVARRPDVDPVLGDHPHRHERREAAPRGSAQPEHPMPVRDLRDQGRRCLPARGCDERRVVGRLLALRRASPRSSWISVGTTRPSGSAPAVPPTGSTTSGRPCGRHLPARQRRSGSSSSPANPRSSTSGCRTTTSCSSIRKWRRTATSSTSRYPSSGRRRWSRTWSTSATRRVPACAGRAPMLGEHTAEVMDELGFSREEIDQVLAAGEGAADQLIAAIFDD